MQSILFNDSLLRPVATWTICWPYIVLLSILKMFDKISDKEEEEEAKEEEEEEKVVACQSDNLLFNRSTTRKEVAHS